MIVQYLGNFDAICILGREWSASSPDQAFSALDLASKTEQSERLLCEVLCEMERKDWVCRSGDDWTIPPNTGTRWWVREHPHLTFESQYEVLECANGWYRILNDRNDPVLYHESLFRILDPSIPSFWEYSQEEDCEVYRGPRAWAVAGYWERYHDKDDEFIDNFWSMLSELYPSTWAQRRSVR